MNEDVRFHCSLPSNALLFRSVLAHESLGRLPDYRVELLRPHGQRALQASELLGKPASIEIRIDQKEVRHLHGLVTELERGEVVERHDLYRLVLRPWLWQLTLGADSRVFQNQTVVQILERVFAAYPGGGELEKRLTARHGTRPYTVQYQESDFNFVSRLMDDEGIHYFFRHEARRDILVLCDNPAAHPAIPGKDLHWWEHQTGRSSREDTVQEWLRSHRLQPRRFTHVDFAAEAPGTRLHASAENTTGLPGIEVYQHPGGQDDMAMGSNLAGKQADGQDMARREADRFESRQATAHGMTRFRGLTAGRSFTLRAHDDADDYLCTASITQIRFPPGSADRAQPDCEYSCRFEAVSRSIHFLPERSARRPVARGPETAMVVGPVDEEIHTDRYGRVRLQFHWDRLGRQDENSSCWVRVSHSGASRQFGQISLPRVGDEVVVDFLDGNPDRPLVTGRVYNGDNLPPYTLPEHATVSGMRSRSSRKGARDNANELRFDDRKGGEYVWLQAERDFHLFARNDAFSTVGRDSHEAIGGNADRRIAGNLAAGVGGSATFQIAGDTHAGLGADLNLAVDGQLNLVAGESVALAASAGVTLASADGLDIAVGASARLSAGSSVEIRALSVMIDAGAQLSLRAGGAFITLGPEGVSIQGAAVRINSGGAPAAVDSFSLARPPRPKAPAEATHDQDPLEGA